jgi:hypothetical protein
MGAIHRVVRGNEPRRIAPLSTKEAAQAKLYLEEAKRIEPILVINRCPREALAMALGAQCRSEGELRQFLRIMETGFLTQWPNARMHL